jgi:hypothetical protein
MTIVNKTGRIDLTKESYTLTARYGFISSDGEREWRGVSGAFAADTLEAARTAAAAKLEAEKRRIPSTVSVVLTLPGAGSHLGHLQPGGTIAWQPLEIRGFNPAGFIRRY